MRCAYADAARCVLPWLFARGCTRQIVSPLKMRDAFASRCHDMPPALVPITPELFSDTRFRAAMDDAFTARAAVAAPARISSPSKVR